MKKLGLVFLLIMISACSPATSEVTWTAVAEYCVDSHCEETKRISLEGENLTQAQTFIDQLPQHISPSKGGNETARLILTGSNGERQTYVEYVEFAPYGVELYYLKCPDRLFVEEGEGNSLRVLLDSLEAEEIDDSEPLVDPIPDDYFVLTLSKNELARKSPSGQPYYEHFELDDKYPLRLLFYIDQDFENVSEIEDQTALLAGLADIYELQEAEKIYGYGVDYTIWNDYLIEMQRTLPVAKIEKHAQKILTGYELPVLDSQMLFENLDKRYLYDHKQAQVIVSDLMTELGRNSMDIYLVPLRMDEQSIRLARVPVRLTYWENYYDMVRAASIVLNDGTLLPESYDYYSLFERVTEVQDQLELFDVSLNEKGQISAVKKVNNPKEADKQTPLSNDQFMLTENGTNSLYTLQDTDQTAWIFNSQMQTLSTMSSNYSNYAQLHSSLSENEQWIVIEVENNIGKWRWLFDKQSGELLSDGLLNERYFNGQLTEIIAKNASDAGYPACPVVYEENLTVEKCAVYPYVADYGAKELLAATPTMFTISENGQLQITLNTRRYGGLAEPLVLELEP